jgi:transposase
MVEKDDQTKRPGRYSAKGNWDKSFIAEVVEEIHNGMSYHAAHQKYNVPRKTMVRWIYEAKLDIPTGQLKRPVPVEQKRSVVRAVQTGRLSIKEAMRTYGIKTIKTINSWIQQFDQENAELVVVNDTEMKKKKASEGKSPESNQDIKALQKALEEAQLKIAALNTLIDVAEEQLKINIRKKPGAKQSND